MPCGARTRESAGTLSLGGGGSFWIVSVSVPVAGASGAGNVSVPPKPFELGNAIVTEPPPGVSENGAVVEAVNNGDAPVLNGGGFVPPP